MMSLELVMPATFKQRPGRNMRDSPHAITQNPK
jgi:hypothetical protein